MALDHQDKITKSLALAGKEIITLIHIIKASGDRFSAQEYSVTAWENEFQRFSLWADNLGLHHRGHSSLDYRLREATILESLVQGLLTDLQSSLQDLITLNQSVLEPEGKNLLSGNETEDESFMEMESDDNLNDYRSESEVETILKGVTDIIDRLYKLAIKIRNPKTRLATSKAVNFKHIDEETGIDLVQEFAKIDTCHIEELFWDNRLIDVQDTEPIFMERRDRERRPRKLIEVDHVLISRLARANTRRRQQFGYWSRHRSKNTQETARALEARELPIGKLQDPRLLSERRTTVAGQSAGIVSRPSTATHLLNPAMITMNDSASTTSLGTVAPNAKIVQDEQVVVPHPPEVLKKSKHFLCPYCFTLCSQSLLKQEAWREHIFRDLRPYVCTYVDCKSGDQIYDSWKDWATHELRSHCTSWGCAVHPELVFPTKSGLEDHWLQLHAEDETPLEFKYTAWAQETLSTKSDRPCPFCLYEAGNLEEMQNHIATHLQRVALFALPRSTDLEDSSSEANESLRAANTEIHGSSLVDLESVVNSNSGSIPRLDEEFNKSLTVESLKSIVDASGEKMMKEKTAAFLSNLDNGHTSVEGSQVEHVGDEEAARRRWKSMESTLGLNHSDTLDSMDHFIKVLINEGKYTEAEKLVRLSLKLRENMLGIKHPHTLNSMTTLATVLSNQGKHEEAEQISRLNFKLRKDALGTEHIETLSSMNQLVCVLSDQGKYKEAEELARKTLGLREKILGMNHPDTLMSMTRLFFVLNYQGKYDEAEQISRRTLKSIHEMLGEEHLDTLICMTNLVLILNTQGKYAEAEKMARTTLRLREKILGMKHPHTLHSMTSLINILNNQDKYEEAEQMSRRALELHQEVLGKEHFDTFICMSELASILDAQGKYAEAEKMARTTLRLREKLLGMKHPDTLRSMTSLTTIMYNQEKYEEAEQMSRRALEIQQEVLGEEHPDTLRSMSELASALDAQGKHADSDELFRKTLNVKRTE